MISKLLSGFAALVLQATLASSATLTSVTCGLGNEWDPGVTHSDSGPTSAQSACTATTTRPDAVSGYIETSIGISGGGLSAGGEVVFHGIVVSTANNESWPATSTFFGSFSDTFTTLGPIRPGSALIEFGTAPGGPEFGSSVLITASIGPHTSVVQVLGDPSCSGDFCFSDPTVLPFTLGTPFDFLFSIDGGTSIDFSIGSSGTRAGASFDVRLTELDGTPVSVAPVPEPATLSLLALSTMLVLWRRA